MPHESEIGLWIVIILLVINTITALVVLITGILCPPGKRSTMVLRGLFFLACPVVGPLALLISWVLTRLLGSHRFDRESLTFSGERTAAVLPPDMETELNYIPIMDALVSADTTELRQLLLNVLKNKSILNIHSVTSAIASEDAETSHYAASALANFLSEFRAAAREVLIRVEQTPEDPRTLLDAIAFFQTFIKAKVMDEVEQSSYIYTCENLNEQLFAKNRWYLTAEHYLNLVDDLISIRDYSLALKWAERAEDCRPDELETYKVSLHLYYAMQDRKKLFETLDRLKHSYVIVDSEVLDMIRLLQEGD